MNRCAVCVSVCMLFVSLSGCGEDKAITLSYNRPAEFNIPRKIRRLAVAEFGGKTASDKQWGEIATDLLTSALDQYNKKFHRYQLYERKRLKAIIEEQQLQMAITDSATATKMGKLADVHAMIWGTVHVIHKDERATRVVPDIMRRRTKTVRYTKRYCMAAVNFTMDDIATGKTLTSVTVTREYDSEKDKKSGGAKIGKTLGFSGDNLPPADKVIHELINQCVEQFLARISPHEITVSEKLEKGKSSTVKDGNKFAISKEYADALKLYKQAIKDRPDDDGAMFNAGLMCEALGELKKAEDYYQKAIGLKVKAKYIRARRRVRLETNE